MVKLLTVDFKVVHDFLMHYGKERIDLRKGADFKDEKLIVYIHSRTNGLVGQVTQLLSMAVELAILTGKEQITLSLLKEIPFTPLNTALSAKGKNPYKI